MGKETQKAQERDLTEALKKWINTIHSHAPDRYHWVGIYLLDESGKLLKLFPYYIGRPTPHTCIPIDKGLCGAAIREGKTLNVADVLSDSRYIACSVYTRSEIVVPIRTTDGRIVGEIDIDSDLPAAFTEEDEKWLEEVARKIGELFDKKYKG